MKKSQTCLKGFLNKFERIRDNDSFFSFFFDVAKVAIIQNYI